MLLGVLLLVTPIIPQETIKNFTINTLQQDNILSQYKVILNGKSHVQLFPPAIHVENIFIALNESEYIQAHDCYFGINIGLFNFQSLRVKDALFFLENMPEMHNIISHKLLGIFHHDILIENFTVNIAERNVLQDAALQIKDNSLLSNIAVVNIKEHSIHHGNSELEISINKSLFSEQKGDVQIRANGYGMEALYQGEVQYLEKLVANGSLEIKQQSKTEHWLGQLLDKAQGKISGNIKLDGYRLQTQNVSFISPFMKDIMLSIDADIKTNVWDIVINGAEIQLQEVLSEVADNIIYETINHFDTLLPTVHVANFKIWLDKVLTSNYTFKGLEISGDIRNADLAIKKVQATVNETGKIQLTGNVLHNEIRPQFIGRILLELPEANKISEQLSGPLVMQSDVNLVPKALRLNSLKAMLGEQKIKGHVTLRTSLDGRLGIALDLSTSSIDGAVALNKLNTLLEHLFIYDFDRTPNSFKRYHSYLQDIANPQYDLVLDFYTNKLLLDNNQALENVRLRAYNKPNHVQIEEFSVRDPRLQFHTKADINTEDKLPNINLDINCSLCDQELLSTLFPSQKALYEKQKIVVAQQIAEQKIPSNVLNDVRFLPEFNFFSLHQIQGAFKIMLNEWKWPGLNVQNINIDGNIINNTFKIEKLQAKLFEGDLNLRGAIQMNKMPNFAWQFSLNNFNPYKAMWYITNTNTFDGYMSMAGAFTSNGNNELEFSNNINGTAELLGRDIRLFTGDYIEVAQWLDDPNIDYTRKVNSIDQSIKRGVTYFDNCAASLVMKQYNVSVTNGKCNNSRIATSFGAQYATNNKEINLVQIVSFIPQTSNKPLSFKVILEGPIQAPKNTVEHNELLTYLQSQVVQNNRLRNVENNNETNKRTLR